MKKHSLLVAMILLTAVPAAADPLADAPPPPQTDPSPDQGGHFPPGVATMGIALVSPQKDSVAPADKKGCSALNPCALPTPSWDRAEAPLTQPHKP